jgi:hypothetical protein
VPVTTIARKTLRFDAEYGTHFAAAQCHQQALESGTMIARAGATQVVIDNRRIWPAKSACAIGKPVLAQLALAIVVDLIQR